MNPELLLQDATINAKAKAAQIGKWLLNKELLVDELIDFAKNQDTVNKATCIEAMEYATKKIPEIATRNLLNYATNSLKSVTPRVKWESAKVIGNIAKLFPDDLKKTVANLLANTENQGTVVRWATAFALAEILKLKTSLNTTLVAAIENIYKNEADNGVKKKYLEGLKKFKK